MRSRFVRFPVVLLATACLVATASTAAAQAPASSYETLVHEAQPECWWRMEAVGSQGVSNRGTSAGTADLTALAVGNVEFGVPGPGGEEFPDFAEPNRAVRLAPGKNYLRVADPGLRSPLDLDQGDALTLEAWIRPDPNPQPTYSYILGKGRTQSSGQREFNQNYSLRLANKGSEGRLSFYFVDAETPATSVAPNAGGHRWTSKLAVPLDGRWHHVAVVYEFGRPDSIRGYIDGEETAGTWDLAGATRKRPVVDDDELWIGSSMKGRATFPGGIDEVAIYRRVLEPETIRRHVRIDRRDELQLLVEAASEVAPHDRVQFDVFEDMAIAKSWNLIPTPGQPLYQSDAFALTELPRKYDHRGVIVDRRGPLLIHAYARVALPAGSYRLALRSLNAARLYANGELVAETRFLPPSNGGHGKLYQLAAVQPDRLSLPAAHTETIVDFESDGTPRVFSLLAIAGLGGRPVELGELVVAFQSGERTFELLRPELQTLSDSPAPHHLLSDDGWFAFLQHDLAQRRSWEARHRSEQSREESEWWARRHAAARQVIESQPRVAIPAVQSPQHVNNEVDRFVQARLEAENIEPAPLVDDRTFLRRLTLDVVGRIPTTEEVENFLADPPESRRSAAIERLLDDPGWADHWVGYWQHVLAENPGLTKPMANNSGPFRWFLHEAFLDNKPLDRLVTELISLEGGAASGGPAGFAKASNNDVPTAQKAHILGTAFLGVEMKCARCHDAPSHEWKQQELFSVAAMLARKPLAVPQSSSVPGTPEQLARMTVVVSLKPGQSVPPRWPFAAWKYETDESETLARKSGNSRDELDYSLVHPKNRRFAEVFVNRLWQRYLGRGFVEPIHDWEGREPSHPELLTYLAEELSCNNYDIKHVAHLILSSQAYQRSHRVAADGEDHARLFAAATRRRLTAEQLVDSLYQAVGKPFDSEELCVNPDGQQGAGNFLNLGIPTRAWEFVCTSNERERPSMALPRAQSVVDLLMAYGWQQDRQEPINERETQTTPLTPLVLANGEAAARAIDLADHGALVPLCLEDQPVEELVERLYLRFLSRPPQDSERKRAVELLAPGYEERRTGEAPLPRRVDRSPLAWTNHLDAAANQVGTERIEQALRGDPPTPRLADDWRARMEDLVWSLANTPEFAFVP